MARRAICTGVSPATIGRLGTCACSASCANWSCAAGRWVSRLASSTRRRSRSRSRSASLPEVVVLPEPCRPTISIGIGAGAFRLSGTAPSPPSASISTSLTILTTCWPGVTEDSTSLPTARSRTLATKSRTTGSATSASSSASRTSRSASVTSASDSAPRPRSRSNTPESLSDSASNTAFLQRPNRRCANPRGAAEPPRQAGTGTTTLPGCAALWERGNPKSTQAKPDHTPVSSRSRARFTTREQVGLNVHQKAAPCSPGIGLTRRRGPSTSCLVRRCAWHARLRRMACGRIPCATMRVEQVAAPLLVSVNYIT